MFSIFPKYLAVIRKHLFIKRMHHKQHSSEPSVHVQLKSLKNCLQDFLPIVFIWKCYMTFNKVA